MADQLGFYDGRLRLPYLGHEQHGLCSYPGISVPLGLQHPGGGFSAAVNSGAGVPHPYRLGLGDGALFNLEIRAAGVEQGAPDLLEALPGA